jgi:hypothetical protein
MRFLPYQRLTLRTDAPPDVVVAKLSTLVSTRRVALSAPLEPFRGVIEGRRFKLLRVLGGLFGARNSWQPLVVGEVVPAAGGSEIRVRMRLHLLVAAFTVMWFGGLLVGAVSMLLSSRIGEGAAALGMAAVGYAMTSWGFWPEVARARRLLENGLGCAEVGMGSRPAR